MVNGFLEKSYDKFSVIDKDKNSRNYVTYMIDRVSQMFRVDGLPETMPERFIKNYLLCGGFCVVTDVNGSLYGFHGGLGGEPDPYYFPTIATIANPSLNFSKSLKIGDECVVVRNDTNLNGILPICTKYSTMLVESDISLYRAGINTRAMSMISAGDDRSRKSAEKFLNDLEAGELGVCGDNTLLESIKVHPVAGNYSSGYITQLLELRNYWVSCFWQELGINSNHNMKRESINSSETSSNELTLLPLVDDMLQNWENGFSEVNRKYGTNITVSKSSAWAIEEEKVEEVIQDGNEVPE